MSQIRRCSSRQHGTAFMAPANVCVRVFTHTHTHMLCVCMYVFLHMCMTLYGTAVPSAPSINCKGVCMCFHISIYSSINTYIDSKCHWRPLYRVLSEAGIRMCVCMYVCMYVSLQSLSAFNQPCKCMCKCIHVSIS